MDTYLTPFSQNTRKCAKCARCVRKFSLSGRYAQDFCEREYKFTSSDIALQTRLNNELIFLPVSVFFHSFSNSEKHQKLSIAPAFIAAPQADFIHKMDGLKRIWLESVLFIIAF